jgi:TolB-like protein/Tfp pilus assembly protein PilF
MKRCPQCNRKETDDALTFCRNDGVPLVIDSAEFEKDAGTIKLGSSVSTETETRRLPSNSVSTADIENRSVAATTVLPQIQTNKVSPVRKSHLRSYVAIAVIVLIFAITAAAVAAFYMARKSHTSIGSIAVMPFVNESGNSDVDYLSDGMTDTLISQLSQLTDLSVKARSSVFRYKGKETNPQTVGKELNVQAILNGRFAQRGDQLTLTLELVNAQTENVIWSEQYNRPFADLVKLQTEIARDVSSKLRTTLSGAEKAKLTKTYTSSPEAYRLYLQGRFFWNKREEKDFRQSIEHFNQAIQIDPNYALAYAGLADAYALLGTFGFSSPSEAIPRAREAARHASALDANLAEPHVTLAYLSSTYDYDLVSAEGEFKQAIALNPNYATAHQWYAELLTNSGRFDEANSEYRRALEIEPLSLPINWDFGRFFYMSRRYNESLAQHLKTIELDPGFARAHRTLGEVYRVTRDYPKAVEERAKFFDLIGQPQNATLVRSTFAKDGWLGFVRLVVAENSPLRDSNNNWVLAKAYLDLGDKNKALDELYKGYDNRLSSMCWLKVEPQMDPLRSEPRFQELLKKMRFP